MDLVFGLVVLFFLSFFPFFYYFLIFLFLIISFTFYFNNFILFYSFLPSSLPPSLSLPSFLLFFSFLFFSFLFFSFFLPLLLTSVADRVFVLRPGVRPVSLRSESRVQDIGPPETSWLHVISNGESSPRDLHLNTKDQLHSTTSKQ